MPRQLTAIGAYGVVQILRITCSCTCFAVSGDICVNNVCDKFVY